MKSSLRCLLIAVVTLIVLCTAHSRVLAQTAKNNLVYHIFVRSFCDGDNDPQGIGDLSGIASKLDSYLNDGNPDTNNDLEVGVLWLMPIFPADDYHGYNVRDYRNINAEYGTLTDFDDLIAQAHQRGVRIILDIPLNHTSHNHAWFKAAVAGDAAMRERYFFQDGSQPLRSGWHRIQGSNLQYFGLFDRSMPDLNFDEPTVQQEVKQIAKFWLDRGVDGFRLDAAKHVHGDTFGGLSEPQILKNNDWWLEFSNFCYSINPQAILVGEVLGDREVLRRHSYGLEGLLDEPFLHAARGQMAFPKPGFVGSLKVAIQAARAVNQLASHVPDRPFELFPFTGSHDQNPRLASQLEEFKRHGMSASVDEAYRLGMYMLLTMGDLPVIYYGQEVMQRGWKWNGNGDGSGIFDETLREPFPWYKAGAGPGQTRWFKPLFDGPDDGVSLEEQSGADGMFSLVRGLSNLRTRHPALANGEFGEILSDTHDWMVFERFSGGDKYLVLINPTGSGKDYHFHAGWFRQYSQAQLVFWSDGQHRTWKDETGNHKQINGKAFVAGYGLVVLKMQ